MLLYRSGPRLSCVVSPPGLAGHDHGGLEALESGLNDLVALDRLRRMGLTEIVCVCVVLRCGAERTDGEICHLEILSSSSRLCSASICGLAPRPSE